MVRQQIQYLCLDRDIQSRHRFVSDYEVRIASERPSDADPLSLTARELVRVPMRRILGQSDFREEGFDSRPPRGSARREGVNLNRFPHDPAHRKAWVEARVWILEHEGYAPAQDPQGFRRKRPQARAVEDHVAGARLDKSLHAAPERSLAAA